MIITDEQTKKTWMKTVNEMRIIVDECECAEISAESFGTRFVQVPDFNSRNPCLTDFRALFFKHFLH